MKSLLTLALGVCSLLALTGVAAAHDSTPSQATLEAMGLSGIQSLSDREAMEVRGFGYYEPKSKSVAIAFGVSYAYVHGHGAKAATKDGYYSKGNYFATGKHHSYATLEYIRSGKHGGHMYGHHPHGGKHHGGGKGHGGGGHGGGHKKASSITAYAGGSAYARAK